MSIAELKLYLIDKITGINNRDIIEEIKSLVDFQLDKEEYKLSNAQRKRMDEALCDETISEEKADQEIEQWLNEK